MSKQVPVEMRGSTLFAIHKLTALKAQPGRGPRVTPAIVAKEIFETAVIEEFERTFKITISEAFDIYKATLPKKRETGTGENVKRPCRLPLSQADGYGGDAA